jgi:hypothetical protein
MQGPELREPLTPKPVRGAIYGTLVGLALSVVADLSALEVSPTSGISGYLAGGCVVGLVSGLGLPLFRNRIASGIVTAVSMSLGLVVAWWYWDELLPPAEHIFVGIAYGIIYATLFWNYHPD